MIPINPDDLEEFKANKTFKEEMEQKFDKEFDENLYVTVPTDMDVKVSKVKYFIFTTLDLYKQKILEALPKDDQEWVTDRNGEQEASEIWLRPSEVKQIIGNI